MGSDMKKLLAILLLITAPAFAQNPVKQSGNVTPGHVPYWVTNGVIGDGGPATNGKLTSLGITASGPSFCLNSAAITTAGWQQMCFGVTTAGGGTISLQNFGTASPQNFTVTINGTAYPFPFSIAGILGPNPTVIGDLACWNNTAGTLLADCGGFRTVTANDTILSTDCYKTLQLGTGSTGQFTETIPAVSGFPTNCVVTVVNDDTTRGKLLTGLGSKLPPVLYPRQSFTIKIVNGVWNVTTQPGRWQIPGQITLFVDPAGNDANDCLAAGAANACLTVQGALTAAGQGIDELFVGSGITVQLACGTYTSTGDMAHYSGRQVGAQGGAAITILGCDGNAEDTLLSATGGGVFSINTGAIVTIKNLAVATSSTGDCISASDLTKVYISNISFHSCAGSHMTASYSSVIQVDANIIIAGDAVAGAHANIQSNSNFIFNIGGTTTFTANATFGTAFVVAQSGTVTYVATFTLGGHTATGPRFDTLQNGVIVTGSNGNLTYYPGSSAGLFASGGQYDGVNTGLSVTKTVRAAGGGSDCTLIFTNGILTGGSC